MSEGNSGTTSFVFAINATGNCEGVQVTYATQDGIATNPDDFAPLTGNVTFSGTTTSTKNVTVNVVGDTTAEGDETFFLNIGADATKATITDAEGLGLIKDDDGTTPQPTIFVDDPSVSEGDAEHAGAFTIELSRAAASDVTVNYTITDGTAKAGTDYKVTSATGTATIKAGATSTTVPFTVVGDNAEDPARMFSIALSSPNATATLGDTDGVATIVDDDTPSGVNGYRMVAADGGIFTFGQRQFWGSTGNITLNKPIVGGATDVSDYEGYWMVASDGGVFNFNAPFHGSLGSTPLPSPAVEIEPTPTGNGYWIVLANGKVYNFGGAEHFGDMSTKALNKPIIGMSVAPDGKGYWLVAEDGGIFDFGSADFFGSMGSTRLNAPVIDLGPMPDGNGYYLVAKDGGVFSFGSAVFKGSTGSMKLNAPVIAMLVNPTGTGYWLAATDGGIFTFGQHVEFLGSMGSTKLNAPVLDLIN